MQAVILAGGQGTRLWPLTAEVPKPMVPVAGKPFLEHQLRLLADQGFTDIVLLTGYLGRQIEDHFGDGSRHNLSIRYSLEPEPLGTAGGLRDARPLLASSFLLLYGDSYLPIDYKQCMDALERSAAVGLMVLYDNKQGDTTVNANVALAPDNRIVQYAKDRSSQHRLTHVEAGALAFRREVVDWIPTSGRASLENDVYPKLAEAGRLIGLETGQRFYDIGTPERLAAIQRLLTR